MPTEKEFGVSMTPAEQAGMTDAEVQEVLSRLAGDVSATRLARGLSLRGLAAESGVSLATLSRIERGLGPDASTLIRLARWLIVQAKKRGGDGRKAADQP